MSNNTLIPPPHWRATIEQYLDNNLPDLALKQLEKWGLKYEIIDNRLVDKKNSTEYCLTQFITVNPQMMVMKDQVRKIAKVDDCVLIVGPTGTGKELIAHALIGDREGEFIAVNSAGLPEQLIESILFGHVKGAFTGAIQDSKGMCSRANGGILFLDEIGDMPLTMQAKLLRAIQEKKVLPVGANKEIDISCRFVCATHKDIHKMVSEEKFREDLYARISTFEITLTGFKRRYTDIIQILKSMSGGIEYINKVKEETKLVDDEAVAQYIHTYNMNGLGVRGLQRNVRRFQILGEI